MYVEIYFYQYSITESLFFHFKKFNRITDILFIFMLYIIQLANFITIENA